MNGMINSWRLGGSVLALCLAACGGGSSSSTASTKSEAATLPTMRGDVWEIDPGAPGDAQALAYLYGLASFVRQGDDLYSGTTRLKSVSREGSALVVKLDGELTARIEERDGHSMLTFSNGKSGQLREHQAGDKK
ncbi:MAG TPA: hypothetical protein VEZ88_09035 [Steroidobacteraceae bacterium]|nr:hypothetical protein [Steroidobacteraceae bacterium]